MNVRVLALCLLPLLSACSSKSSDVFTDGSGGEGSLGDASLAGNGAVAGGTSTSVVTYWQDMRPLLEAKCTACHVADGIAPFALDNYATARQYAGALATDTDARKMPPWPPGALSLKMLHDRSLTPEQIKLFSDWANGGALEGDAATPARVVPPEIPILPSADLSADIGVDYVPPSNVKDEYRCFLLDLHTTEDRVSVGYRVTPGNPKIVHHVITTLFDGASVDALRALDADTPDVAGWPCAGGPVPFTSEAKIKPVGALGSWVPGVSVVLFPEGTGSRVPSGAVAVMQVHYNLNGEPGPDRTKIEVALAPKGEEPAQDLNTLRIRNNKIRVPVGAKDVAVETTMTARELAVGRFYADGHASLRQVAGHMHMVGVQTSLTLERASGEKLVLLDIPAWDFHWQGSYTLQSPIELNADDKVTLRCVYDNTPEHLTAVDYPEPAHLVTLGEGSTDEMCIGYLTVTD